MQAGHAASIKPASAMEPPDGNSTVELPDPINLFEYMSAQVLFNEQ